MILDAFFNLELKMTALDNIIKRAMSLMKEHVQYSQSLAVEFSHLMTWLQLIVFMNRWARYKVY